MKYFIAVDGGGTKTEVACADATGKVITSSVSGPTSLAATNIETASLNFLAAISQITDQLPPDAVFDNIVIGLAGLDTEKELEFASHFFQQKLHTLLHETKLYVMNDIQFVIAAGATSSNAVALISGTGSQCYGRNQAAKHARASGLDYLLSDQGSGYEIGRQVLRTATASFDGRVEKSLLEQLVLNHFQVTTFDELKEQIYSPPLSKTQVAELAPLCFNACEQGDALAQNIINQVIEDLVIMVQAVVTRLELSEKPFELITSGSILKLPQVYTAFSSKVTARFPQATVKQLTTSPVQGGIKIGLEKLTPSY